MANVEQAIQYVLRQEDATLQGTITRAADGKRTRFGVDEHFHPELTNCLFYDTMGSTAALKIAERIFERSYAEPLCVTEIQDQAIANKLLSLGVNCGVVTAAKMLQDVLGVNGDGRIGPLTMDALDKAAPTDVLEKVKQLAVEYYLSLIKNNPKLAIYREGWMRRAEA